MPLSKFFYKIWNNALNSVRRDYGLSYFFAALFTYLIVIAGFDIWWRQFALDHMTLYRAGFAAAILGFFVPMFGPIVMYLYGRAIKQKVIQIIALALGQASFLGLVISSLIKVFTGRIPPSAFTLQTLHSGFQFGFYRGGAFNGWPSSHTTVAFAMAFTLIEMHPKNTTVKVCALTFAIAIGFGVSLNIHWLSDVVAGILVGYTIGKAVGKSFKSLKTSTTTL